MTAAIGPCLIVYRGYFLQIRPDTTPVGMVVNNHMRIGPQGVQLQVQADGRRYIPIAVDDLPLTIQRDNIAGGHLIPAQFPGIGQYATAR